MYTGNKAKHCYVPPLTISEPYWLLLLKERYLCGKLLLKAGQWKFKSVVCHSVEWTEHVEQKHYVSLIWRKGGEKQTNVNILFSPNQILFTRNYIKLKNIVISQQLSGEDT